jgi:hypothetical protein
VGQDDAWIGEQAAPMTGVMASLAEFDDKVDGDAAAGAQRNVGNRHALARSVEGDEHIGGTEVAMLAEERQQSGGAGSLAGLDHDLGVTSVRLICNDLSEKRCPT